jgi:hypothetical protein
MVHGAADHHPAGRHPSLRQHLHRDVLHLHLILGLQDLLRLRIHAIRSELNSLKRRGIEIFSLQFFFLNGLH